MQYGMIITPGESSTIIYDNASINKSFQVSSMSGLVQLLAKEDIYPQDVSRPSVELLKRIEAIPSSEPSSIPYQIDRLGLGSLFNIASPEYIEQLPSSAHQYFQSTSFHLANSKVGTVTTVPGGEAHAGFGSSKDTVRVLLFWTRSPASATGYDGDTQDTKVTAMMDIALRLWDQLPVPERQEMLHLVYLCLMMSFPQYKMNCHRNYVDCPRVAQFLIDVTTCPRKHKSIINSYAKNNRFFVNNKGTN